MVKRTDRLRQWLAGIVAEPPPGLLLDGADPAGLELAAVAGDASFRRYWRLTSVCPTLIVMDAPPELEPSAHFVQIAEGLRALNLPVPRVFAADLKQGFLLLEDFGDCLYGDRLLASVSEEVDAMYREAIDLLVQLQRHEQVPGCVLPRFDAALYAGEYRLFTDWFLRDTLELALSSDERALVAEAGLRLEEVALGQPARPVHRDYHSRNLLWRGAGVAPGIIDFQDAVIGPVTYDLVSLLKDCYLHWPAARVAAGVEHYWHEARAAGIPLGDDPAAFRVDFERMGMQRHLKAIGIFARLALRDGKPNYLKDVSRILLHLHEARPQDPVLEGLQRWLQGRVAPVVEGDLRFFAPC